MTHDETSPRRWSESHEREGPHPEGQRGAATRIVLPPRVARPGPPAPPETWLG